MCFLNKNSFMSFRIWKSEQHLSKAIADWRVYYSCSAFGDKTCQVKSHQDLHCHVNKRGYTVKWHFYSLSLLYIIEAAPVWSVKQTDPWPDLTVTLLLWALLDLNTSYQPRKWIHILPALLSHVILSLDRMNNSWWRLNQIVLTKNFFVKLCVRHLKRFQNWILMLISHTYWFIMILERHTVVDAEIKVENLNWLVFLDSRSSIGLAIQIIN